MSTSPIYIFERSLPAFHSRSQAGHELGLLLEELGINGVCFAIPCSGLPVALALCEYKKIPYPEILRVTKIRHPDSSAIGLGAVSESGSCCINMDAISEFHIRPHQLDQALSSANARLGDLFLSISSIQLGDPTQTALVVDDGSSTGYTALVAQKTLLKLGFRSIIFVAPIISRRAALFLDGECPSMRRISLLTIIADSYLLDDFFVSQTDAVSASVQLGMNPNFTR